MQKLNWHPTIDKKVRRYELQQRMLEDEKETERLKKENARLAQINSKLERFEREHLSGSSHPPFTGDSFN